LNDIVEKLCEIAASMVVTEDKNGISALEYAIEEEAELKIIKKLQKSAANQRKNIITNHFEKPISGFWSKTRVAQNKLPRLISLRCKQYRYLSSAQQLRRSNYIISVERMYFPKDKDSTLWKLINICTEVIYDGPNV